jgi:hypothetical protein
MAGPTDNEAHFSLLISEMSNDNVYNLRKQDLWIIICLEHLTSQKRYTNSLSQQRFNILTPFNFLLYSLHILAPGHPQVRYTISYYFCF